MQDMHFMRRALSLASLGSGQVTPNPLVGAVLVHNGRIIGEGFHAIYGDVHAEVACLQNVLAEDKALIPQSTMYVTLEPCAHHGKQPPCAERLIREGLRHVVVAVKDPFLQVSGKGIAMLEQAGIKVDIGVCNAAARWLCRRFLSVQEQRRPYIVLKWAASADGYFAPANGSRQQLSNYFSQALVHKWRTEESAIMVGYNTALADNPQLTARLWRGRQPLRIVLDRNLSLPSDHYLLDNSTETWIVNERVEAVADVTSFVRITFNELLLQTVLERLVSAGKTSLFVEGGAYLLNTLISAGLWDEARIFTTQVTIEQGIPSPVLKNARLVHCSDISGDVLSLYQRTDTLYPYPTGAIF